MAAADVELARISNRPFCIVSTKASLSECNKGANATLFVSMGKRRATNWCTPVKSIADTDSITIQHSTNSVQNLLACFIIVYRRLG